MTQSGTTYDAIGAGYARYRRPDARIARMIADALGECSSVVNVGAGAGSYEPRDRRVIGVEPSATMLAQRPADAAPAVQGVAEQLPLADGEVDAAMAVLTIHHWTDPDAGLREMRRVARDRIVILTWDPESVDWWLVRDYFPDIIELDRRIFLTIDTLRATLGPLEVREVPVPHDCTDGFLGAYWRRPEAYLDADVRGAISSFTRVSGLEERIGRLGADIASGVWHERNRAITELDALDLGYRLIIAECAGRRFS